MEHVGLLAPIAFIFSLAALAQISSLKKEVEKLKKNCSRNKTLKTFFGDDNRSVVELMAGMLGYFGSFIILNRRY